MEINEILEQLQKQPLTTPSLSADRVSIVKSMLVNGQAKDVGTRGRTNEIELKPLILK